MAGHSGDTQGSALAPVEVSPGSIIGRAFQIYRAQWMTLLGAAVVIFGIQFLLALLLPKLFFIAGIAALILGVFYQGMVVNLVRDVQDGRRDHSIGELFSAVAPVALPLIGLAIVAGIAIAIGFVLIVIPGLILLTIWAVAGPVMVIEHPGVFAALGRSRDLVRGYGWPVFGTIVLVFLIDIAINIVAAIISSGASDAVTAVVNWIAATLAAPIVALTSSVLYFALLAVKEHAQPFAPPQAAAPPASSPSSPPPSPSPFGEEPSSQPTTPESPSPFGDEKRPGS
jgi:hypothetical protein